MKKFLLFTLCILVFTNCTKELEEIQENIDLKTSLENELILDNSSAFISYFPTLTRFRQQLAPLSVSTDYLDQDYLPYSGGVMLFTLMTNAKEVEIEMSSLWLVSNYWVDTPSIQNGQILLTEYTHEEVTRLIDNDNLLYYPSTVSFYPNILFRPYERPIDSENATYELKKEYGNHNSIYLVGYVFLKDVQKQYFNLGLDVSFIVRPVGSDSFAKITVPFS